MRIAFHAPLKPPDHPVPSGDRLMARLLIAALARAGHRVDVVSTLRPYLRAPDAGLLAGFEAEAARDRHRIAAVWGQSGPPDLWLTYHPYYKSPDLLGPPLARAHGLPYVTAESSWSRRRDAGDWGRAQTLVAEGLAQAALNLCLTERDRAGILEGVPGARTARLTPFIDSALFAARPPRPEAGHLVTVAMMRPGDKLSSYLALAAALARLAGRDWHLSIAGDGPARPEVAAAFAPFGARVRLLGALEAPAVADLLARGALYLWPGHGEAYGLACLEAQAAGLPVVAENVAGLPEVVEDGRTGLLTPAGDTAAYAGAIADLLDDDTRRRQMAQAARAFGMTERGMDAAAARLDALLRAAMTGDAA